MADLIDRLALGNRMYHEAFEKDSDMQKWDSGCWIRYKLFENVLRDTPSVDAVEVVQCKDCRHYDLAPNGFNGMCNRQYATFYAVDFCSYGEQKE